MIFLLRKYFCINMLIYKSIFKLFMFKKRKYGINSNNRTSYIKLKNYDFNELHILAKLKNIEEQMINNNKQNKEILNKLTKIEKINTFDTVKKDETQKKNINYLSEDKHNVKSYDCSYIS